MKTELASDDEWWRGVLSPKEHRELERISQEIVHAHDDAEDWVLLPIGVQLEDFNALMNGLDALECDNPQVGEFISKLVAVMALEYYENDLIEPDEGSTAIYRAWYNPEYDEDEDDED